MEVYGWDGQPVALLKLDVPVSCFAVDESELAIYALNPEFAENKILKFIIQSSANSQSVLCVSR